MRVVRERGRESQLIVLAGHVMSEEKLSETVSPIPCPSSLTVHPLRLHPGEELRSSLLNYVRDNRLQAPFVMTCCGSLTRATLRLASHTPADGNNKVL